jgi:hypothetical protein
VLNPYKQVRVDSFGRVDPFEIADILQPVQQHGCIGRFFDNVKKQFITVNLGHVVCYPVLSYRAASSDVAVNLSRVEGAAPCESSLSIQPLSTARPQLARTDGTEALMDEKSPGTYVIPGQVIPRYQKC